MISIPYVLVIALFAFGLGAYTTLRIVKSLPVLTEEDEAEQLR